VAPRQDAGREPIDLDRPWQLAPNVALRPESFGALAYHFGTRRLSFLKSRRLADTVTALAEHPTARDACARTGVTAEELPRVADALGTLARTGMIVRRAAA
jgi:putative mycofactocin binding protein MftB